MSITLCYAFTRTILWHLELRFQTSRHESNHQPIRVSNCCVNERQRRGRWAAMETWHPRDGEPVDGTGWQRVWCSATVMCSRSLCCAVARCVKLSENSLESRVPATVTIVYRNDIVWIEYNQRAVCGAVEQGTMKAGGIIRVATWGQKCWNLAARVTLQWCIAPLSDF